MSIGRSFFVYAATIVGVALFSFQPQAVKAQEYGGTFIKAVATEPSTLDHVFGFDFSAQTVMTNIYNPLIRLDYSFVPHPELAESWKISDDGKTYTFKLRSDVKWTDGTKFTAEDVKFTFSKMTCEMHNRSSTWCPKVESFETVGDDVFIINMKQPFAALLTILADHNQGTLIRPKHVWEKGLDKNNPQLLKPVVSTGPFKFSKWVKGSHIELVRNDKYFKKGLPYLDRVVIQFLPDEAGRLAAFQNGDIDMLHSYILPYEQVKNFRKDPKFQIVEHGNESTGTNQNLLLNHNSEYLKHKQVRQAIAHALDKESIADKVMFGASKVAHAHIAHGVKWAYFPEFDYKHDVKKANELLDAAGFKRGSDGMRFALRSYSLPASFHGRTQEVAKSQLRDVGIELKIRLLDRPTYIELVFKTQDFDLAWQLFTTAPDPSLAVVHRYKSSSCMKPYTNACWKNKKYDELTDGESLITDVPKRAALWKQIEELLMEELPAFPIFEMPNVQAVRAGFKDVIMDPLGYNGILEHAYKSNDS
jgi:peptide/nickel transport system substrate-binding protein